MGPLCADIPEQCNVNPYRLGDFVFSRFAREAEVSSSWNPLVDCSFGGAALFAPSDVYEHSNRDHLNNIAHGHGFHNRHWGLPGLVKSYFCKTLAFSLSPWAPCRACIEGVCFPSCVVAWTSCNS